MYRTCAFYAKQTGKYLGFCADGEPFCIEKIDTDVRARKYAASVKHPETDERKFVGECDAHIKIPD